MIVTCQSCLQHYKLDESKVNPLGSKVKCTKCKAVFTVFPPDIEPMVEELAPISSPPSPTPSTTQAPPPPAASTTKAPPPPTPSTTQAPPPRPTPSTTQAPPPRPTPSTTQAPKSDARGSADQEVVLEAGPDDVVIVMPGAEKVPAADAVEAGPDEVIFATSGTDTASVTDTTPSSAFEAAKDPGPAGAAGDESPKIPSVVTNEYDQGDGTEETSSKKGCLSFFFFLLLLPAILYGALVYLDKKGFEMPWLEGLNLPYISQSSDVKQSLPHELITVTDINSRFIRNNEGSPLFVISGKLTNKGSRAQQAVQVSGEIFDEANSVLARKIVVGGRFLSDLDLLALSQGELDQKLSSMNKADETPVLDVGASIPFMVVFSDLDDRLKEFSIKVTESEPAL